MDAVDTDRESTAPLPWVLGALPRDMLGVELSRMVLLKILDTLPDESFGDLYYEIHEEKEELYFVSGVNREAWPEGIGEIGIGFKKTGHGNMATRQALSVPSKTVFTPIVKYARP